MSSFKRFVSSVFTRYYPSQRIVRQMSSTIDFDHQDFNLICPTWEEAIIREGKKPDISFDQLQKETIEQIHKQNNPQTFSSIPTTTF